MSHVCWRRSVLIAALGFVAALPAVAQFGGTATGTAKVIPNLTVNPAASPLAFGTFSAPTGGTIAIDANSGSQAATGSVVLYTTGSRQLTTIAGGDPNMWVTVTATGTFAITSGAQSMQVINVSVDCQNPVGPSPPSANICTTALDGTGQLAVGTGGVLVVSSGQVSGNYSGTFTIAVDVV